MAKSKKSVTGNSKLDEALEQFPGMNNKDALDVGLALQQIFRGQTAILNNQEKYADDLRALRERMDKYDKAAEKFEEDREKFIENVLDKAESLKAVGSAKDKLVAEGALQAQEAIKNARANIYADDLKFKEAIRLAPKVSVTSPGILESGVEGGQPVQRIVPEEVRIRNMRWVLPPGMAVDVPKPVADVLANRRRSEQEDRERQAVLRKNLSQGQLVAEMAKINEKYNSPSDLGPSISEV